VATAVAAYLPARRPEVIPVNILGPCADIVRDNRGHDRIPASMNVPSLIAVFDLGGVLIDWNPRYLYRKLFAGDETGMEQFLTTICTHSWNTQQDAGRTFAEGCASLKALHPHAGALIDAWFERYDEMLAGPIPGTVDILSDLRARGVPLYALSNWSSET